MIKSRLFGYSGGLLTALALASSLSMSADNPRSEYYIKLNAKPQMVRPYATTLYNAAGNEVTTLRGNHVAQIGDSIISFEINPAGINFLVVSKDKKGTKSAFFRTDVADRRIGKFNNKQFGTPASVSYTADGRSLLLATEKGINVVEPKKFELLRTIDTEFLPTEMIVSKDGYFLAVTDGKNVTVYNFEEGKPRKTWKLDENVTDMKFSPDNSRFAILTDDGLLEIYDTRNFTLKQDLDDLGRGLGFSYNLDGKYVGVITSPETILVINLLRPDERILYNSDYGATDEIVFLPDSNQKTLMFYNDSLGLHAKRMPSLEPYYAKLMADEVSVLMNDWLAMQPGETMEQYRTRVTDETRAQRQRLFEDEISTRFANNLISMSTVSLGNYDRANQVLEVDFDNMPSIFLPVPEADVTAFADGKDLTFTDAEYGLLPNDSFELIYAKVHNGANGRTYIYDNRDRRTIDFLEGDENVVSIAVIRQQQMEEMKLQELRERVIEEAKSDNIITNHTNIAVKSRVDPTYDANGNKIMNYIISVSYEVEPGFSAQEDFGPGKYHVEESGAANSMLRIIKEALEGDFARYVKDGKKVLIRISGTADSTPVARTIPYDGSYGDFEDEIVYKDGTMTGMTVDKKGGITQNEQLAFLRAYGVKDFIEKNIPALEKMNSDYRYDISVAEGKGSEFRRITTDFTFVDAF